MGAPAMSYCPALDSGSRDVSLELSRVVLEDGGGAGAKDSSGGISSFARMALTDRSSLVRGVSDRL